MVNKMTAKARKPHVRFKGFTDDWEEQKLGKVSDSFEYGLNAPAMEYDGINKYIRITDINDESHEFNTDDLTTPNADLSISEKYKLKKGDILFARTGASVGKTYIYKEKDGLVFYAGFLIRARIKTEVNAEFIFQNTLTKKYNKFVKITSQRSGQPGINAHEYSDFSVLIPTREEQNKIAKYFEYLDFLINLHQRKHDKLITVKKAMLEKMFPRDGAEVPEIRFKGFTDKWTRRKFGETVIIQRGGSPRPIEDYITTGENGINWIKIGDVAVQSRYITSTKEKISPNGEKKSRRVFKGDLILSNSMSFGRPYIMAIEGCIHDGWLLIRDEKGIYDIEYLLQLLSSEYMLKQYKSLAAGGVVNNLNSNLVQSTVAWVPHKSEQVKIGAFFQKLDSLVCIQQQELEKLKNVKKALLDKMFV